MVSGIASWSATRRLIAAGVVGIVTGLIVGQMSNPPLAVLCGIAVMASAFVGFGVGILWPMSDEATRDHCQREDFKPAVEEPVVAAVALASIVASSCCSCSASHRPATSPLLWGCTGSS